MCGKAYDPRLIVAWPSAKIAVMGGEQAAKTMLQIQVAGMQAKGKTVSPEEEKQLLDQITANYTRQTKPEYAAARLWVDAIIDPKETRMLISEGITASNHNPNIDAFNTGVFQV
jgi:acetyl-CoA carboxylase carboxyltransferase component